MDKIINKGFAVLTTAIFGMLLSYIAIWNGLEFVNYEWVWNENYSIKALQILTMIVWGGIFCTSPLFVMGGVFLFYTILTKR